MLLFTQPTVYIDYLKQIFDPVDCTSPIHRLNEHVGTLKYADYWHNRLWVLETDSRWYIQLFGALSVSKKHFQGKNQYI